MGEDFTLARLFYVAMAMRDCGDSDEAKETIGRSFDRLPYQEKVEYNDGLRAVFRAAEANPGLARGLR